jgi:hypothetical protein
LRITQTWDLEFFLSVRILLIVGKSILKYYIIYWFLSQIRQVIWSNNTHACTFCVDDSRWRRQQALEKRKALAMFVERRWAWSSDVLVQEISNWINLMIPKLAFSTYIKDMLQTRRVTDLRLATICHHWLSCLLNHLLTGR